MNSTGSNNINRHVGPPLGDGGGTAPRENMYYGASSLIFKRAEELRNTMTPAEEALWNNIHINAWKLKFRRQHPIANYVVDFYCHAVKLVIELDGSVHNEDEVKRYDAYRESHLKELGLTILRFSNDDIFKRRRFVLDSIANIIDESKKSLEKKQDEPSAANAQKIAKGPDTLNKRVNPLLGDRGNTCTSAVDAAMTRQQLYVIKIGGNIIDDEAKLSSFLKSFAAITSPLQGTGANAILVHGGGKLATKLAAQLGVEQQLVDGRRITDAETLKIVTMVYAGYINKNIVAQLQSYDCNAIGLCGADGNVIQAHKRKPVLNGQLPVNENSAKLINPPLGDGGGTLDYGFVGDVDIVNASLLKSLLDQDVNIVLAPITHNKQGQLLNTNADTIAQEIAQAMGALYEVHLIYSFEKAGVLLDANDDATVIQTITPSSYKHLKEKQVIFAGMIPKLDNAFAAISKGVHRVIIGKAEELAQLIEGTKGTSIVAGPATAGV